MFSLCSRRRILIPLTIILILAVAASIGSTNSAFFDPEDSTDNISRAITEWYDLAWGYRKEITINNTGSTLTDYQVKVTVDTQTLIGQGKMQSDGDDIRFTKDDGVTEIPYWIESGINTTSTEIWVKMSSIPNGTTDIYIYYGNDGASAGSSASSTFTSDSFQDSFADISNIDIEESSGMASASGETRLLVADNEILDVSQTEDSSSYNVYGNYFHAQTFYVNFTGYLTKVTIRASTSWYGAPPNDLEVQIRNVVGTEPNTEPGDTIYATASRNGISSWPVSNYDFTFNVAPAVTAGTQYALVIKTEGGSSSYYYATRYRNSNVYSEGRRLTSSDAGQNWSGSNYDLYFQTYITTNMKLDQIQASSTNNRQVYGDNWSAQSFKAEETGDLAMVILQTYATGSPADDLTVEIHEAEQTVEEFLIASQTDYYGNRLIYDDNWLAQTFYSDSAGDLSRIVLRGSKAETLPSDLGDLVIELRDVTTDPQEYEDQTQTSYYSNRRVFDQNWLAQIFEAGINGDMTQIDLRASKYGSSVGNLTVQLRDVNSDTEENMDVNQTSNNSQDNIYGSNYSGQTFQAGADGDLSKVTVRLLRQEGDQDQYQTSSNGSRVIDDSDEWYAQTFTAGQSDDLGKVVLWVSETGDPTGDVTVELRNTVDGYEETEDQSQTSNNANVQVYDQTWIAQTFYPGMSGDLTKVTLRASKQETLPSDLGDLTVELRDISGGEAQDVSQTSNNSDDYIYDVNWSAQTFQADETGLLTKVTLRLMKTGNPPNDFTVQLRDCTGGDLPGTNILATATMAAGDISTSMANYDFVFATPASVTSGTKYSIVISTVGGWRWWNWGDFYTLRYQSSNVYSNGRRCTSTNSGSSWSGTNADLYFVTYINPGALPGSTTYATATNSNITTAGEYDFTFSSPYSVSAGTQYSLVVYASGGSVDDYYNVSYQGSNVYTSGRGCLSTDSGDSWTGYDTADVYFKTYVEVVAGKVPGDTVLATTSRNDIDTTAGEHHFTFSSAYAITQGTQYAIVVHASGVSASNYYSVYYQTGNPYANGDECSSTNQDTDWSISDTTDLYFRTLCGLGLGDVELQIRNCTDDLPGSAVLATCSIRPEDISTSFANYDFVFDDPAEVVSGVKYSIVIKTEGGEGGWYSSNNMYQWRNRTTNVYSNGRLCLSTNSGSSWSGNNEDYYFQTYVSNTAYTPGDNVLDTVTRSNIGSTIQVYEFDFTGYPDDTYCLEAGEKYAIVIYTTGGNAYNYYNISYEDSDAYTDGRECSSSNSGTDWTGSNSTDLYFTTYVTLEVGDRPGTTVYTSDTISKGDIGSTTGLIEFDGFSPSYSVQANTSYSLVIYTTGGDYTGGDYYNISYENSDNYELGKECSSSDGGSNWSPISTSDLYFQFYVETTTDNYEPGDLIGSATASRNDIGSIAAPYTFIFSNPCTVTSGQRYTIVVSSTNSTSGSNCYNVAYYNMSVYSDGNDCWSDDGGSSWTATDYDLYFQTYVEYDHTVSASGSLVSVSIEMGSGTQFAVGNQLIWNDTEQTNSDIKYQLEYYTGSTWSLVPDSDLPGNSTGFDTSGVNISSVKTDYQQFRLVANLSSTYSTDVPSIQEWAMTYYYREYVTQEPTAGAPGSEE